MAVNAEPKRRLDWLTREIIGSAIAVHKMLGPGLLETVYSEFLALEMTKRGLKFEAEKGMPVILEDTRVDLGYRMDLLAEELVAIELKAVDRIHPIHRMKLHTYLKLSRIMVGLLINFNVTRLTDGIVRMVNGYPD